MEPRIESCHRVSAAVCTHEKERIGLTSKGSNSCNPFSLRIPCFRFIQFDRNVRTTQLSAPAGRTLVRSEVRIWVWVVPVRPYLRDSFGLDNLSAAECQNLLRCVLGHRHNQSAGVRGRHAREDRGVDDEEAVSAVDCHHC